jgi:hypothetical protein
MDLRPNSAWRKLINDEFQHERYTNFRNWYFKTFKPWELSKFKEEFYNHLNQTQDYIPFVKWFTKFFIEKMEKEIMVLQSKSWLTTEGNIITSPFPPEKSLTLGKNVEATAYLAVQSKKTDNNIITLQEFNSVIRSQNYTNSFLNCLGNQLTSIEQELINLKNLFEKQIQNKKDYEIKIESTNDTPIIQPPIHIEGFKIQKDSDEFAQLSG